MTVKELIKALKKLNPDAHVVVSKPLDHDYPFDAIGDDIRDDTLMFNGDHIVEECCVPEGSTHYSKQDVVILRGSAY